MTKLEKAIGFAMRAHHGMRRKKENIPYIIHPLEVVTILAGMTDDEDVLSAAVLHDTVEDTGVSLEAIEKEFGPRVMELVKTETEDKRKDLPASETWFIRKKESLDILRETRDIGARMLWLSDKLANIRSLHRIWMREGDAMWKGFNQDDPVKQAWYYRSVADILSDLSGYEAWKEYRFLIDMLFKGVPDGQC